MNAIRSAIIVGAGIAGPACALAFAKVGIRSTIVESHPAPADGVGAIITLAANGLDVLHTLGAAQAVVGAAQPISTVQMSDAAGHVFARYPSGGHVLARDALARILAGCAERGGSRVDYGRRLIGVDTTREAVSAHFADGSVIEADIIVGADGIHSTLRDIIDPAAPSPVYEGVLGFGAVTQGGDVPAEPETMNFAFGRRFLGYWRLPNGRICWYAALPHADELTRRQIAARPRAEWLSRLRAEYTGHDPAQQLLATTTPDGLVATGSMLRMPTLPHWHDERCVLIGDAAHAPSSSSGQGASLALEDAVELARCLRDIPDRGRGFAIYETFRRPHCEAVAAMAAAANRAKAGNPSEPTTDHHDPTSYHIDFDKPVKRAAHAD